MSRSPQDVSPIDAREFAQAVLLGIAAGESEHGAPVVADSPRPDGSVEVLEVPDSPHSRAAFALRRHFLHDDGRFESALARFRALVDLLSRGVVDDWVRRRDSGRVAIHPAVLDVASQVRLSRNGRFPPRKFVAAVSEVASIHYPHLDEW